MCHKESRLIDPTMLNVKFYILSLLWKQTSFIVEKCKCWSLFCESCSMFSFQGPTHCIYNIQTRGIEPRRLCSQLERLPRMRKVWRLNPSCDRPTSLKQVVTSPLLNARQQVWVSRVMAIINAQRSMVTSPYQREHLEWNKRTPPPFFKWTF